MTREEITEYALRYISQDEVTEFPMDGDLFCFVERPSEPGILKKDDEGWHFGSYGVCTGYVIDEDARPLGKWIWMNYLGLNAFPPEPQVIKLQPPHVVKGQFQNADRTHEIRILRIPALKGIPGQNPFGGDEVTFPEQPAQDSSTKPEASRSKQAKILQFPGPTEM